MLDEAEVEVAPAGRRIALDDAGRTVDVDCDLVEHAARIHRTSEVGGGAGQGERESEEAHEEQSNAVEIHCDAAVAIDEGGGHEVEVFQDQQ